jgi:tetratricopeptide (TPR) repeat protein
MYDEIYEKYRTRLAGLYARLYQARCEQKLGKHKEAMALLNNDVFSQPDQPDPFRTLKIKGTILAMESWGALNQNADAISKAQAYIDKPRPTEDKTDEFMELRYLTAKAMASYIEELKKKDPKDKNISAMKRDGMKLIKLIGRVPNEFIKPANLLLPSFTGEAQENVARTTPKSFEEAKTLGGDAIREMQSAQSAVKALQTKLPTAPAPDKAEITKQIEESKKTETTTREDAMYYFGEARRLVNKDTSDEDLALVLYLTCFLKFSEQDYMGAVVLGEWVAKRYPASAGARQCAKICLASYLKLYGENKDDDKSFESEHIVSIADYIVKKWPDQPEAEEALNTLIPFMIKERQLARAQEYLDKIPLESAHRGTAELKTGQALWSSYLETSKLIRTWETGDATPPEGTDVAKKKADLEQLKTRAQQTLIDGVTRMQKQGEVTPVVATAALSLAQIYVDTNQPTKSTALLEDPKIGPLTLLAKKNEVMNKPGLPEETYKTALRAYISSLSAKGTNSEDVVKKAKGIMDNLKSTIGSTEEGQKKLVSTYVGLARDLQTQMENSTPEVRSALGRGFEAFLEQVAVDANELNILNWVGETYRAMAESFITKKGEVPAEAVKYLEKAMATFERILDMGKKNASFLTGEMATLVKLQVAKTYRQLNKPKDAVDKYEEILKERQTLLPVQKEAALTYMEWAEAHNRAGKATDAIGAYQSAMRGARPVENTKTKQKKNVIWGWGEMSRITANNDKFSDAFHEARVYLSQCRYKMAMIMTDKAKKEAEFKQVKADITITRGLYPKLGGEKWFPQYEKLYKDAQVALKEKPTGIPEVETSTASTTSSSAEAPKPPMNTTPGTSPATPMTPAPMPTPPKPDPKKTT